MNITTFKKLIKFIPASHTVMLKGYHGIGKTEVIRQVAKDLWGQECVEFQASQIQDVGDLIGLQRINAETQETEWVPPFWFKKDRPVTLFLDEINRGKPAITNAMMQLALDHRILNFTLPEGSHIVCAINPSDGDGMYDVEDFEPAKKDRFRIIELNPSVDEWLEYATKSGVNSLVRDYIQANSQDLDPWTNAKNAKAASVSNDNLPSRRSWSAFGQVMNNLLEEDGFLETKEGLDAVEDLCSAYVGHMIAINFRSFVAQHGTGLNPKTLFENKWTKKTEDRVKKLCQNKIEVCRLGKACAMYLDEHCDELNDDTRCKEVANIWLKFLQTIDPEFRVETYTNAVETAIKKKLPWVKMTTKAQPKLKDLYYECLETEI